MILKVSCTNISFQMARMSPRNIVLVFLTICRNDFNVYFWSTTLKEARRFLTKIRPLTRAEIEGNVDRDWQRLKCSRSLAP